MSTYSNEILFAIIATSIVFTLLVSLVGVLIFFHRQKVKRLDMEREIMQAQYKQTLLQSQVEMQEQTFDNISREIHDNVGQLLSLAKLQLSIIERSQNVDRPLLSEVKDNIGNALADLRDIAKSLSGERMKMLGFIQTIEEETERINRSKVLQASLSVSGQVYKFSLQKQLIMVRIVQEALQNIIKHSQAKNADVAFLYLKDRLELTVSDNGKGFNSTEKISGKSGLGLQNIMNRTEVIGGVAAISSTPNKGTEIKLSIPYE